MSDQKNGRVLALMNYLLKNADENHHVTMEEIMVYMDSTGHGCSQDTIARMIKQINEETQISIKSGRGRSAGYYPDNRIFEKEELLLIIDAINASTFINKNLTDKLADRLRTFASKYEVDDLNRSVLGVSVAKSENDKILQNVNVIQRALKENKQISFDYMVWNSSKKLVRKSQKKYTMNPWALIWANGRYYLYGYDTVKAEGADYYKDRNYRVDKLSGITVLDIKREGSEQFKKFDAGTYVSRRLGMFAGTEEYVDAQIPEYLIGAFIDQFGRKIVIKDAGNGKLNIRFTVVLSDNLYGWLIGLRDVEVLGPQKARDGIRTLLERNYSLYDD